jgi:hypothetical protein
MPYFFFLRRVYNPETPSTAAPRIAPQGVKVGTVTDWGTMVPAEAIPENINTSSTKNNKNLIFILTTSLIWYMFLP